MNDSLGAQAKVVGIEVRIEPVFKGKPTCREVGAAECGEVRHWFESGGGLFPLDALTISGFNCGLDDPIQAQL